jgi:UDP-GlcNAc:undecaprenyl-phosphate GlcNAc-1-phosphate transferase
VNLASVVPFLAAFLLAMVLVPLARRISFKLGRVSQPREDRWHRKPTATLGGIGIFAAFWGGLLLGLLAVKLFRPAGQLTLEPLWLPRWGVLLGASLAFGLGVVDDLKRISPPAKLVGQILIAAMVIFLGYTTNFFSPRISNEIVAQLPNILLTFFWLVGITNAINLLDNMDGLAGGISLITAGILSYFFWRSGDHGLLSISLALAGGLLGFLVYNFPPASIFMGDSGSLFLGFTLAVLAIARQPQASNVFAVLGVPTLLFLLPILDTTLVTFTRLLRGQSPAQGGRDHTSHRLIAFGLTERQAVLTLYGVALFSGILAAALESIQYWFSLVLVPLAVVSLALLTAYLGGLKVVTATGPAARDRPLTRIMLMLTYRRRLFEVVLDFLLIGIAYYLAFLARYGLVMNETRLALYLQSLPLALVSTYLCFYFWGVYRGVWRYIDIGDLLRYIQASVASVVLTAALVFGLDSTGLSPWKEMHNISVLNFLLFGVFLFLGLAASRSSFRVLRTISKLRSQPIEQRVLVYPAGDAGEMAVRWLSIDPRPKYQAVGFLDDDPFMVGRMIHGLEVLGGPEQLEEILQRSRAEGVILAGVDPSTPAWEALRAASLQSGCWMRSLKLEFELVE